MKYCNNCKTEKYSWKEKGHSGTGYENRCYTCDKYTLEERGVVVSSSASEASANALRTAMRETKELGGSFEYKIEEGRRMDGTPYRNQNYKYNPKG